MKTFILKSTFCLALSLVQPVFYGTPCGNPTPGGPGGAPNPTDPATDQGDPVTPYTGNEHRRIDDLELFGAVNPMTFSRFTNSRGVELSNDFGLGHHTRHAFQWNLIETVVGGTVTSLELFTPEGSRIEVLSAPPSIGFQATLQPNGLDYIVLDQSGDEYLFVKQLNGTFLMTQHTDPKGLQCLYTYNVAGKLTRVTEPAGRYFDLLYAAESANVVNKKERVRLTAAPSAGQWMELAIPAGTPAGRFWMVTAANLSYANIAEVEFYNQNNIKVTGTLVSSDPLAEAGKAVDGNPLTGLVSTFYNGAFVGYQFASNTTITKVRVLALPGTEPLMFPAPPTNPLRVESGNSNPAAQTVISRVQSNPNYALE
jgi:hypothetical protein